MPIIEQVMPVVQDKRILCRKNPKSKSLRAVVVTSNPSKFDEIKTQLGNGYGMDVQQWCPTEADDLSSESGMFAVCLRIMENQNYFSPHFILREDTTLISRDTDEDLTELPLDNLKLRVLERVAHRSQLNVYKSEWEGATPEQKKLSHFTQREYNRESYGYIKPNQALESKCIRGFGWDALFVNAATNMTNEAYFTTYGKKSARQHVVSDFIETYLRYKTLVAFKHHELLIQQPIQFGGNYIHLSEFIENERHFSNPYVHQWGIKQLRTAMVNEGMFLKSAWSRPVKSYFSQPFSGVPLTAKKDEIEETIFMTHDIFHHAICDLVCDHEPTQAHFYVYSAWRNASEACTIILADMFYADGLNTFGVPRTGLDKRIYPLFEAIKAAQAIPDPDKMLQHEKIAFIRKVLFASTRYSLLGDDREWIALLTPAKGSCDTNHIACLEAYKKHFEKIFIGDNAWTRANFDNMYKQKGPLEHWIQNVGADTFKRAHVPLLSEVCSSLTSTNLSDYDAVVNAVFDLIFETKISPYLACETIDYLPKEQCQSNAFRRFLIGQVSLFSRYPAPLNLGILQEQILDLLHSTEHFSVELQDSIRTSLKQVILGIEGLGLMSREEARNAVDCSTVFPPVYISFAAMENQYETIRNCVEARTLSYSDIPEITVSDSLNVIGLFSEIKSIKSIKSIDADPSGTKTGAFSHL
jgi:inosine/xanthosine triphosphate pyrophosphatase family protein